MSLTILGNFREELDLDITVFADITDDNFLRSASYTESDTSSAASTALSTDSEISAELGKNPSIAFIHDQIKPVVLEIPRSTSTLLQGTKRCSKTIFLFPDGAGSATSYVTLPPISPNLQVVGLNSPYLTKPQEFNCALQGITGSYMNEVRRRQPHGPYHLAGWSAGGVSAFDAV